MKQMMSIVKIFSNVVMRHYIVYMIWYFLDSSALKTSKEKDTNQGKLKEFDTGLKRVW